MFNAERCRFTDCKAGELLCLGPGIMVGDDWTFPSNAKAGLEVRESGILTARNSRIYNNSWDGLIIEPTAAKCAIFDCKINHNDRERIAALDASKQITLMRNYISGNNSDGVFVRNSDVDMRENKLFDNEYWGIWSQTNLWRNVSMNDVFRDTHGGVLVGKRVAEKTFPPSVVELNTIHDNYGPGYVDNINRFEDFQIFNRVVDLFKTASSYKSAKFLQNALYNNEKRIIVTQSKLSSSWCSGCFGKCENLKLCGKCLTSAYCNPVCQKFHWSKHKKLCKILREKSSFLITTMERRVLDGLVNVNALDEVSPKYSSPPPQDGKRFIVKFQTDFESESVAYGKRHMLVIYDCSLKVDETFQSDFIDHFVRNYGILCERKYQEKKLFLYFVFEKDGKLRLFINDFVDFR